MHTTDEFKRDFYVIGLKYQISLILTLVVIVTVAGNIVYRLAVVDSLLFFAAIFTLFYIPGVTLIRFCKTSYTVVGAETVIALSLGVMLMPITLVLGSRTGISEQLYGLVIGGVLLFWFFQKKNRSPYSLIDLKSNWVNFIAISSLLGITIFLLHFSHFTDVVYTEDGFLFRNSYVTETTFHQGIVASLVDTFPPPALYDSGGGDYSYYHLGLHLQVVAIHKLTGVSVTSLMYFYFPSFYFSLLVLLPYFFVKMIGGKNSTAIVSALLIFGSDMSFVPGIANGVSPPVAWNLLLVPSIWSLFTMNGLIPSVIALYLMILFIWDYFESESQRTILLLGVTCVGAFVCKVTMGLHMAAVLFVLGIYSTIFQRHHKKSLTLIHASIILLMVMGVYLVVYTSDSSDNIVSIRPFNLFTAVLSRTGLEELSAVFYLPAYFTFLVLLFGIRYIGYRMLSNQNNLAYSIRHVVVFAFVFTLSGLFVTELFFIGVPGQYDNSVWFVVQGLFACWVLVFLLLKNIEGNESRHRMVCCIVLILAMPSTIQFLFVRFNDSYYRISNDAIEVVNLLSTIDPNDVVLHPLNLEHPSLASNFAGKPSVVNVFMSFLAPSGELDKKVQDVNMFFSEDTTAEINARIISKYAVDYLYFKKSDMKNQLKEDSYNATSVLENAEYRVLRVN